MIMAKLFYIIGASGVGKDSLLGYARQHLRPEESLFFAHRYITRKAEAGNENHVALSEQEFRQRLGKGFFAMHWSSHGLNYGIGVEVNQWLKQGVNVVVNGSRAYLPQASKHYAELVPVLIQVDQAILRQRLESRGRETSEQIEARLLRAQCMGGISHPGLVVIDNNADLSIAGKQLVGVLTARNTQCV
jgi:ribose 1,5-bisphosphokinase|tara:strand:+ start:76272 stop:76838 length:567 start_codon:yes stop_codon:yes gene_type:complete